MEPHLLLGPALDDLVSGFMLKSILCSCFSPDLGPSFDHISAKEMFNEGDMGFCS